MEWSLYPISFVTVGELFHLPEAQVSHLQNESKKQDLLYSVVNI